MKGVEQQGTWIQCQTCGKVYYIEEHVPIDELYTASICPRCGEYGYGLNCGSDQNEIYIYINENFDPRFYMY